MEGAEYKSGKTDQLEQSYSEFVSLAVHDLDSPLRKLGVFIDKLSASLPAADENVALYMNRINACLLEMRDLVSSLSEFDAVGRSNGFVSCDLADILSKLLVELGPEIKEKNAKLSSSGLPVVKGLPGQYQLLFRKLLQNALKFTSAKPVNIDIRAEKTGEEEMAELKLKNQVTWHRVTITDNGIGFPEAVAEKIFEPFTRLHGKSAYRGSGLGLAICKKIMENHMGRIFAEGNEQTGSKFTLLIPENPENA